jgi:tetratricopeptide (TPR) repeat protein
MPSPDPKTDDEDRKKEDRSHTDSIARRDVLKELTDSQRMRLKRERSGKKKGDDAPNLSQPSDTLARLGATFSALGRPDHAVEFYEQALEGYRTNDDQEGEASTLASMAAALWQQREPSRATAAYEQAAAIYRLLGNRSGEATALNCIGLLHDQNGDLVGCGRQERRSRHAGRDRHGAPAAGERQGRA